MSEYNIEDIKLGNHNIVKAYKGDDLIFDRNAEYFIQPIGGVNDAAHIPVLSDETSKQLTYGDVFIFDFIPTQTRGGNSTACFIGGSCLNDHGYYAYPRYWGIHVGYKYYSNTDVITLAISAYRDNGQYSNYQNKTCVLNERQTMSFSMQNPHEGSALRDQEPRTIGGFFLFGYREFDTGDPLNGDDFVSSLTDARGGKFYRIAIKDSSDNLKYDFKPKIQNGHLGMIDLVTDTFYPCNDDTKFRISQR